LQIWLRSCGFRSMLVLGGSGYSRTLVSRSVDQIARTFR
jgi:hypothetical protein